MEKVLWDYGFEGRSLIWTGLAAAVDLPVYNFQTVRRAIGILEYRKCIVC